MGNRKPFEYCMWIIYSLEDRSLCRISIDSIGYNISKALRTKAITEKLVEDAL